MANDYLNIVCRHCGHKHSMAKGYYGDYYTGAITTPEGCQRYVDELNDFFNEHGANCEKAQHNADNARDHFIILGIAEKIEPDSQTIVNVWDSDKLDLSGRIKLPEDF